MPHGSCRDTPSRNHAAQIGRPKPLCGKGSRQVNDNNIELIRFRKPKVSKWLIVGRILYSSKPRHSCLLIEARIIMIAPFKNVHIIFSTIEVNFPSFIYYSLFNVYIYRERTVNPSCAKTQTLAKILHRKIMLWVYANLSHPLVMMTVKLMEVVIWSWSYLRNQR